MKLSFVSNIDMGGAITAQARNFISNKFGLWRSLSVIILCLIVLMRYFYGVRNCLKLKKLRLKKICLNCLIFQTVDDCLHKFILITKDVDTLRNKSKICTKLYFYSL